MELIKNMPDIQRNCQITNRPFVVTEWEQQHLAKMGLPLPTICIEERHRRRLAHRNERSIYKNKCHISGKEIISIFSPDKPYKVLSQDVWWSDQWDPRDYGRDFDFSRPFFEQFAELQLDVPHLSLLNMRSENSEYCNITNSNKNCYLVFGGDYNEDCYYSVFSMYCKNSLDLYFCKQCQLCYNCIDCNDCYNLLYSQNSYNCRDSFFLFECRNVSNSFGCVGLRNKEYHIFNKPYSKEDYEAKIKEFNLHSRAAVEKLKKEFAEFKLQFPHRAAYIINSENITGNNIVNSNNCQNCFELEGPIQDAKDLYFAGWETKDLLSSDHVGFRAQLYYEMVGSIEGYNCAFCTFSWTSQNTYYCDTVMNSKDLFGCSNMKKAQYCILNKQYGEKEYHELKSKIIEHMKQKGELGEFFPIKNSLFAYNETVANDMFVVDKNTAAKQGWQWYEEPSLQNSGFSNNPDSIKEVSEDILNGFLQCETTKRPFKIIPQELAFYKKMNIPLPADSQEIRNKKRIARRLPPFSWQRNCFKCQKSVHTSYAPGRPEKIYCEECYLAEIY